MTRPEPSLLPPQYVNVSAAVTYSDDLSASHFRTYVRLVGLAWRDAEHTQLPPLSLAELATLCHLKSRAMRLHLQALAQQGLLVLHGDSRAYQIQVREPEAAAAQFSEPLMPCATPPVEREPAPADFPPPTFAAAVQANLAALAKFGVRPEVAQAQRAAALPHVTPDLIRAWGEELPHAPLSVICPAYYSINSPPPTSPPPPNGAVAPAPLPRRLPLPRPQSQHRQRFRTLFAPDCGTWVGAGRLRRSPGSTRKTPRAYKGS